MSSPRLVGEIIAEILLSLENNAVNREMEADWEDITDVLKLPCVRATMLEIHMDDHTLAWRKDGNRIKAYKPDLLRIFGTTDFRVRRRLRHD